MRLYNINHSDGELYYYLNVVANKFSVVDALKIVLSPPAIKNITKVTLSDERSQKPILYRKAGLSRFFLVNYEGFAKTYRIFEITKEDDKKNHIITFVVQLFYEVLDEWQEKYRVTIIDKGVVTKPELEIIEKFFDVSYKEKLEEFDYRFYDKNLRKIEFKKGVIKNA